MNTSPTNPIAKLWSKNYILLLAINLLMYLGFYMLVPTLPVYATQLGGSPFAASLVISIFSITALVFRLFTGNAVDFLGKKPIVLSGILIMLATTLSFIWLSVTGIIICRIFQGIGWGMASAAMATAVSDLVPPQRRGEGLGYYALTTLVTMALAPIVAIMIMNRFSFTQVAWSSLAFCGSAVLLLPGVVLPRRSHNEPTPFRQIFKLGNLFEKRALLPAGLCFLLTITLCGIMSYIMLYGKELGMGNIWVYFLGHVTMILITRSWVGKLFDAKGPAIVIIPGAIAIFAGLIILSYAHNLPMLITASLLYGLGYGAVHPSLQAWALNRAPLERQGAVNGTYLSAMDLSFTFGSMVLSLIATWQSYAVMYRASSLLIVVFLIIYGLSLKRSARSPETDDSELTEVA